MNGKQENQTSPAFNRLADKLQFPMEQRCLLLQAMTHPAFFEGAKGGHRDNQRLEFLGDAVLDLQVGDYLYQAYPEAQEGDLSKMRAYIVCEASLATAALEWGIDQALRLGHGSEAGGDRSRPSILADAFEAMLGAVYAVMGYDAAYRLVKSQFAACMDALTPEDYADKKSLLQEIVQAKVPHGVTYKLLSQSGPDHQPHFTSAVYCGRMELGQGSGGSKKESEVAAASTALKCREQWLRCIE